MARRVVRHKKARREFTKKQQHWISQKIGYLIGVEGKKPKQAAAQAYNMMRLKMRNLRLAHNALRRGHRKGR